jgi:hypothetical protein
MESNSDRQRQLTSLLVKKWMLLSPQQPKRLTGGRPTLRWGREPAARLVNTAPVAKMVKMAATVTGKTVNMPAQATAKNQAIP